MKRKRAYLVAVQIGLAGIVAAGLMMQVGALRYFGYGELAESLIESVGIIAAGALSLTVFIPQWAEKFRQWWHLESEDNRATDLGKVYRQLEQERAAKEAAELELMELRQQRGSKALENIREMLHDDIEYRALLDRAEAAERMAESMDKQLREQAEKIKRDGTLIKRMAARLEGAPIAEPQETTTDTGLAFPYSTKQLEAMRDAATKYWQAHDRAKPAPHGIQKQVQIFLSERIGNSDRKVAELAAAIKPDDLPEK